MDPTSRNAMEMQCKTGNSDDIYFQTYGAVVPICSRGWRRKMGGWGDRGMGDGGWGMGDGGWGESHGTITHDALITTRKRSLRRLCFYICLSVFLFMEEAGTWAGTPQYQVHPLQDQVHPPGRYTPWGQVPPDTRYPPFPGQCMLGDTGNKRAVRILLECIIVSNNSPLFVIYLFFLWLRLRRSVLMHSSFFESPEVAIIYILVQVQMKINYKYLSTK